MMKGLVKFFLILGAVFFLLVALNMFLISVNVVSMESFRSVLDTWLETVQGLNVVIITGLLAVFCLIISAVIFYAGLKQRVVRREVTFANPLGEVKVSSSAIAEFIRKVGSEIEEVKEIKPRIILTKKGIEVHNKITLYSTQNIPELTDHIQNVVRRYVQDVLGIQEVTQIKIMVEKIIPPEEKKEQK